MPPNLHPPSRLGAGRVAGIDVKPLQSGRGQPCHPQKSSQTSWGQLRFDRRGSDSDGPDGPTTDVIVNRPICARQGLSQTLVFAPRTSCAAETTRCWTVDRCVMSCRASSTSASTNVDPTVTRALLNRAGMANGLVSSLAGCRDRGRTEGDGQGSWSAQSAVRSPQSAVADLWSGRRLMEARPRVVFRVERNQERPGTVRNYCPPAVDRAPRQTPKCGGCYRKGTGMWELFSHEKRIRCPAVCLRISVSNRITCVSTVA